MGTSRTDADSSIQASTATDSGATSIAPGTPGDIEDGAMAQQADGDQRAASDVGADDSQTGGERGKWLLDEVRQAEILAKLYRGIESMSGTARIDIASRRSVELLIATSASTTLGEEPGDFEKVLRYIVGCLDKDQESTIRDLRARLAGLRAESARIQTSATRMRELGSFEAEKIAADRLRAILGEIDSVGRSIATIETSKESLAKHLATLASYDFSNDFERQAIILYVRSALNVPTESEADR